MRLFVRALTVGARINTIITIAMIFCQAAAVVFCNFGAFERLRLRARTRRQECFNVLINYRLLNRFSNSFIISSVDRVWFNKGVLRIVFHVRCCLIVFYLKVRKGRFRSQIFPYNVSILRTNSRVVIYQNAPRIENRNYTFFRRFHSIRYVFTWMAILFIRLNCRIVTFCSRVVVLIISSLQGGNNCVNHFRILRVREQYFMVVRYRLVLNSNRAYKRRAFTIFRFMRGIRRPFLTNTNLTSVRHGLNYFLEDSFWVVRTSNTSCFSVFRCLPFRVMNKRIARRILVRRVCFPFTWVNKDDPSVLMGIACFVRIQVEGAIKTSRAVIARIVIEDIGAIRVSSMDVSRRTIFSFPTTKLIGRVPSGSALRVQVFASRVPVFFRAALQIARYVNVFALGR